MAERQMSNLEETSNHHEDGFDLENPDRITDASEHEHENDEQYADEDTYTKRTFGCRWITAAIVVVTILVIFLSSGTFGVAATKNQDVDKEDATTVGGGGELGKKTSLGEKGNTEVVKIEKETVEQKAEKTQKTEKSKKSKKSKKGGRSLIGQLSEMAMMEAAY